ncbi:MAG: insulinase family protein [Betaproteobacteria bacterium]|nr:MAG: insulinase family protein [Betaproteobacteria bacterium]
MNWMLMPLSLSLYVRRFAVLCVMLLGALIAQSVAALALPTGVSQGPSVAGITEYRLANGLTVLLFPDNSQAKLTVNISYLVGSRHENYGETGQAHLLEHMLFKGSPKVPDVNTEYTQRAAQMNAITRADLTNYFATFPASDDNLKFAITLEADRMVNAYLRKADLDKEFSVVRNEFEAGENNPGQVLTKRLFAVAYDWHNYGKLPIGNRSDIENVSIENLRSFYKTYYQPDNAVLLVAGKFDPALALVEIAREFGAIAKPTRTLPKLNTVEPTQDGERSVVVRGKGDIQIIAAAYKVPGTLHPDMEALGYAALILSNTPSGRLHKKLVETQKALGVGGQPLAYLDPHPLTFLVVQKAGENVEALREAFLNELEKFAESPPTDEEMQRTRTVYDNIYESMLSQPERVGLMLSSYIALGDWRLFFYGKDNHKNVTAANVQAVAKKYFIRDNRTVATFLPENAPQRAEIAVAPSAADVLKNWKPTTQIAQGENFEATAKNIDARTQISSIGELKIALLPKKTRNETVQVRMSFNRGDETSRTGRENAWGLARNTVMLGNTKFSRAQLSDELQKRKLQGGAMSFETRRENLVAALELAAQILHEPTFPESELELQRKESLAGLEFSKSEPAALVAERLGRHFNAYPVGHPFYRESREEIEAFVKRYTRDELVKAYADFAGTSNGEIAIVGDFDPAAVLAVLRKEFSPRTSKAPYARIASRLSTPPAINEWIDTPGKENATLRMSTSFALKRDHPEYAALWVANEIVGAGGLDSRLMARVRGKEGLSYGISSSFSVGVYDAVASWGVNGIAAPQNVLRVERAVLEEIASAREQGFSAEEIARIKSGVRGSYNQNYANDAAVASMWLDRLDRGLRFADYEAFIDKVLAVTPEQARDAFRKYVDPAKLSIVKAGDKKKAEAK